MTQVALLVLLALLGQYDPVANITIVAVISTSIAIFSAVQDIVIDAYRREILTDEELGLGNSIHVNAYRISGLIPGGLSLILADSLPWDVVFIFTALFMIPGLILSLFLSKEPDVPQIDRSLPFYHTFALPFKEFFSRKGMASALGLISLSSYINLVIPSPHPCKPNSF